MDDIKRGDKVIVETARGDFYGTVTSVRMAPPTYLKPMAISVDIPGRANIVIFPADKVRKCY